MAAVSVASTHKYLMFGEIDYIACGFCKNEDICSIRKEYLESDERRAGGTSDLAKKCGKYSMDGRANAFLWGSGAFIEKASLPSRANSLKCK